MSRDRWACAPAAVIAALAAAGAACAQPTPPQTATPTKAATLTRTGAAEGFYLDVARCLYSHEHNAQIAELPAEAKAGLRPALASERRVFRDPAVRVWTTDVLGSAVILAEVGPNKCQVLADQLPVDATFRNVVDRLHKADPALRDDPVKPGYWPFVYQVERKVDATRFTVLLEGSEPGGLAHPLRMAEGHASRFSLLIATVERSPGAPAASPAAPAAAGPGPGPVSAPAPPVCGLTLPAKSPSLGPGTVRRIEDQQTSVARVFATQRLLNAQIDPDYADTPRVIVKLDSGELMAVATPASMQLQPGDRVEALQAARNPALPCNYLPPRVGSKLSAPAP